MARGARVNATNRGDDTPLHLAAAHGHQDIVHMVSRRWYCKACIFLLVVSVSTWTEQTLNVW
jgi:hypothetical protein